MSTTESRTSQSEDSGLAAMTNDDLLIYSVGISTGAAAEMRMAKTSPARHIIATTIDKEGATFAKKRLEENNLCEQVEVRLEDVSRALPYPDGHFDYIYARLVLHYLSKQLLHTTLLELHRILKPGGKLFVVVRSNTCPDALRPGNTYDEATGLTSGSVKEAGNTYKYSRYFHTEQTIGTSIAEANFATIHVKRYDEKLFKDFQHTVAADHMDNVIEVLAARPS